MYTLKSIAQRGVTLGAAFAIVAAAIVPAAPAFADALNPLTERSLLLSSSAPGFTDTDGSGNSFAVPNAAGENYAPAGSGPNGKKSGETFTFKTSTTPDSQVKGFSLQYCTTAAGKCQAPGNNQEANPDYDPEDDNLANTTGDFRNGVYDEEADGRPDNAFSHPLGKSDFDFVGAFTNGTGAGQFEVKINGVTNSGWSFTKANLESSDHSKLLTGKNNYVTLTNASGATIPAGVPVQIIFRPSETVYITNPGADAFFVKINTYSSATSLVGSHNDATPLDNTDTPDHTVIDGGVTVANVMTDSIHITTKVLETMAFSVGTRNRDTVALTNPATHGPCDAIQVVNNNRLNLGNPDAEYSLETGRAWDTHSYWRLSSNSSGGATVYYSGNTLANTVGDEIAEIGATAANSLPGAEQFGLAFRPASGPDSGDTMDTAFTALLDGDRFRNPELFVLTEEAAYANGVGNINNGSATAGETTGEGIVNASFAFEKSSLETPVLIAEDDDNVISCDTAKMRYVANIGADTPAGVYTTKINYLAAPQY